MTNDTAYSEDSTVDLGSVSAMTKGICGQIIFDVMGTFPTEGIDDA